MNRAHCDQCDKADHEQNGWLTLKEMVFPKPFPKGLMDDDPYGRTLTKDFCSFKCLKAFVAKLPDNRKGFSLSELLSQKKKPNHHWKVNKSLIQKSFAAEKAAKIIIDKKGKK